MPGIQDVGSEGAGPYARMLAYAHPGHHKTSLIGDGTAGRVLIVRSPIDNIPARILRNKNVKEWVITTWEEMSGDSDSVLQFLRYGAAQEFDWVWLDCVSIVQWILLDDVWAATVLAKPFRANLTPTGGMDKGEYWRNAERLDQFIRHAVGTTGYHFGVTAHVEEGDHPDDPEKTVARPYIHVRGMVSKICGYMNLVGLMSLELEDKDDENSARHTVLRFRESPYFYAKDLYDAFPTPLRDPTLGEITDAVRSAYEAGQKSKPSPARRGGRAPAAAPARGRRGGRPQAKKTAGRGR